MERLPPSSPQRSGLQGSASEATARGRTRALLIAGIALIVSTPITSLVSFAIIAIAFGEERLERSDGLTPTGWLAMLLPAVLGLCLLLWSRTSLAVPGRRTGGLVLAGLSVLCVVLGASSISGSSASGDASIGGGILVLAAVPLALVAMVLLMPTVRLGAGRSSRRG